MKGNTIFIGLVLSGKCCNIENEICIAMKKIILFFLITTFVSCSTLRELASLKQCEFRMQGMRNIVAAGVNISGQTSLSGLNLLDAGKILNAVKQGSLPVNLILDIEIRNPNKQLAALNKTDYIAYLDGNEIFNGSTSQRVEIPGNNQTATLPLNIQFDLIKLMQGKTQNAIINLLFNLAGASSVPSTLTLKVKPSITLAGMMIPYPGFIDVTTQFGGK